MEASILGCAYTEKFVSTYAEQAALYGGSLTARRCKTTRNYKAKAGVVNSGHPLSPLPVFLLTDGLAHMLHCFLGVLGADIGMAFFGVIDGFF